MRVDFWRLKYCLLINEKIKMLFKSFVDHHTLLQLISFGSDT